MRTLMGILLRKSGFCLSSLFLCSVFLLAQPSNHSLLMGSSVSLGGAIFYILASRCSFGMGKSIHFLYRFWQCPAFVGIFLVYLGLAIGSRSFESFLSALFCLVCVVRLTVNGLNQESSLFFLLPTIKLIKLRSCSSTPSDLEIFAQKFNTGSLAILAVNGFIGLFLIKVFIGIKWISWVLAFTAASVGLLDSVGARFRKSTAS